MTAEDRTLTITRTINKPRERVWQAWTTPEQLVAWWSPEGFTTTIETMDVRSGGRCSLTLHGTHGDFSNLLVFDEVDEPSRLSYRYYPAASEAEAEPVVTTIILVSAGDKTKLTLVLEYVSKEQKDFNTAQYGAVRGANQTIDRLDAFLR
ncbi:MAG: SRPBCC domain-containing protein [Candidatus Saccharibacteria bacterium]